jgi:hypothetical protein
MSDTHEWHKYVGLMALTIEPDRNDKNAGYVKLRYSDLARFDGNCSKSVGSETHEPGRFITHHI